MLLQQIQMVVGYIVELGKLEGGPPNTAFAHHQSHTYALVESNLPFRIKIDQTEKNFDIKSVGNDDFDGDLKHNVSAHPKVNANTGEFSCFGYDMEKPLIHYTLFDKNRKIQNSLDVKITSPRMIHDFIITNDYIIVPDLPFEFKPDKAMKEGTFVFQFDKNQPSRYGIMKKLCQNPDQIQWFTLPTHYTFHFVNAWEDKNEQGQAIIKMYGCPQDYVEISLDKEHPFLEGSSGFTIKLAKYIFNLETGEATMETLVDDLSCEFPIVNQKYIGQKNRYAYLSYLWKNLPTDKVGQQNLYF